MFWFELLTRFQFGGSCLWSVGDVTGSSCRCFWAACCVVALAHAATAGEPLHVRIDQLISTPDDFNPAASANDSTFLGRAYLDFAGIIPSRDVVHSFLDDRSNDKRKGCVGCEVGHIGQQVTRTRGLLVRDRHEPFKQAPASPGHWPPFTCEASCCRPCRA